MVKKENIVTCRNCGRSFDNYYRVKSKWREFNLDKKVNVKYNKKEKSLRVGSNMLSQKQIKMLKGVIDSIPDEDTL